ncbi:hypothetical protein LPJ53_006270, partial [Coemansia erecta]
RIVTTPIGRPLRELDSILKLIVVVADAMRAHGAIRERTGILHRDVSDNNILFYEPKDGDCTVRGLLIDFDHAIVREDDQLSDQHIERSGTLPFMSVNNLAGNYDWCTSLDDWESIIYLMIWIGTYGFNSDCGRSTDNEDLLIHNWVVGKMKMIAKNKRLSLSSKGSMSLLMSEFIKDIHGHYKLLQKLIEELRATLVDSSSNPQAVSIM